MPATALPARPSPLTRALAWSLALHGALVIVAALPAVREALATWQASAEARAAAAVPEAVDPMEIEVEVPEVTVVRPPPQPAESFIRTDGLPEARPDPGRRRFISDRDTRAASPLAADPSATEAQPTQDGIDIPVVEVIRKEASDGEDEALPPSAVAVAGPSGGATGPAVPATAAEVPAPAEPSPLSAPAPRPLATAEAAPPAPVAPPAPEPALPDPEEMPAPVEERLALARESEVVVRPERPAAPTTPPPRPAVALRDPVVDSRPPAPRPEAPSSSSAAVPPAGFSGLRTPTRLRGTISNQGPASVDAEDTPTGRYMKQVTSAIEKEWHRKKRMNRDFVTFGTIKLEFHVDARGQVRNLSIKNRSGANAVMQDFTLNAVLDAKIPPMPEGLSEILDRELLLISYDIIVY